MCHPPQAQELASIVRMINLLTATGITDYCATKAAIHSLNILLAVQLNEKNVHVVEIIPP